LGQGKWGRVKEGAGCGERNKAGRRDRLKKNKKKILKTRIINRKRGQPGEKVKSGKIRKWERESKIQKRKGYARLQSFKLFKGKKDRCGDIHDAKSRDK